MVRCVLQCPEQLVRVNHAYHVDAGRSQPALGDGHVYQGLLAGLGRLVDYSVDSAADVEDGLIDFLLSREETVPGGSAVVGKRGFHELRSFSLAKIGKKVIFLPLIWEK